MTLKSNIIGGEPVGSGDALFNVNPSDTNDQVGEYAIATRQQVVDAAAAARIAQPIWAATTSQHKSDILLAVSTELLARAPELGELLAREEGKTRAEGTGEVIRVAYLFRFFAGECQRVAGERLASVRPDVDVTITREPVGVIGVITPWNFPIAIAAWKIAPALAFGNSVVFKPSELTPALGWELVDILVRAGVTPGAVSLVMGGGDIGAELIEHVDAVTFTGSIQTGQKVVAAASRRMIKAQCEMGGKNPLIVLDDADLDLAVNCALDGSYFQTGQRCTASSRLIVQDGIHDRFVALLSEKLQGISIGNALDAATQVGPVIDQRQLDKDMSYVGIAEGEDANVAVRGELLNRETPGFYLSPTLLTETVNSMRVNQEEVFGPVASVIRVKDFDEAMMTANDTKYGLSAGIITNSHKYARAFEAGIESGLSMVNLPTAGLDYHVPFGGRKASSFGPREQGTYAVEFYTIVKTSYRA